MGDWFIENQVKGMIEKLRDSRRKGGRRRGWEDEGSAQPRLILKKSNSNRSATSWIRLCGGMLIRETTCEEENKQGERRKGGRRMRAIKRILP